jgi:SAM-dependent methyltransferase
VNYLSHLAELGATNLHPHGLAATAQLIDHLNLQPGQQVLEIGCGTGETLVRLALIGDVHVTGADVLPEMLRVARRRLRWTGLQGRTRTVAVEVGAALPFSDNSYDRVLTESVLGFQDAVPARKLLAEIFRVLKPGGLYVANEAVWKPSVSDDLVASIYRSCQADFGLCHASAQNWPAREWCDVMRAAGFAVLSAEKLPVQAGHARHGFPLGIRGSGSFPRDPVTRHLDRQTRLLLSRLVRFSYRVKASLSPRVVRRRLTYRRRLRRHSADGDLIEPRLFVLKKPPGAPGIQNRAWLAAAPRMPPAA